MRKYRNRRGDFNQNVGKPGVIYILVNDGLHPEFIKIGCSTRSGHARATDLNSDANTGTPALYRCIFEHRTSNCGLAERKVFAKLHQYRRGKFGQEFFKLDPERATPVIIEVCTTVDVEERDKAQKLAAEKWAKAQKIAEEERVKALLAEELPWLQRPFAAPAPAPAIGEMLAAPKSQAPTPATTLVDVAPKTDVNPAKVLPEKSGLPWAWITLVICVILIVAGSRNSGTPSYLVPTNRGDSSNYAASNPPTTRANQGRKETPMRAELTAGGPLGNTEPNFASSNKRETPALDGRMAPQPTSLEATTQAEKEVALLRLATPALALESINAEERASINAVCSKDKYQNGPAAYNRCLTTQLTMLEHSGESRPNLSSLNSDEKTSIRAACSREKYQIGPAAYNKCLTTQLALMERSGESKPDLSSLSKEEKVSINSVCSTDKYQKGPAAYNSCLINQLRLLRDTSIGAPDLSSLSREEKVSIAAACSTEKYNGGPAKYNNCLLAQMLQVERSGISRPDLSGLTSGERSSIEAVCATDKYQRGPAAYNRCLQTHLRSLR